jgi:hypothetical protein
MILLVTPSQRAQECAVAIEGATGEPTTCAHNLLQAMGLLRAGSYRAVVFDEHLMEAEPHELDTARAHLGTAIPVEVNFVLSGIGRVVNSIQCALDRRALEESSAREAAVSSLHLELNTTLTELLLRTGRAQQVPGLPPGAVAQLAYIHESAQKLRAHLEVKKPDGDG